MLRMADVYFREGNLENAYILYLKFLTLFIEKVLEHPEYPSLAAHEKNHFTLKLKEVLPKTESLKKKLLVKFRQEHEEYKDEMVIIIFHIISIFTSHSLIYHLQIYVQIKQKKQEAMARIEREQQILRQRQLDEENEIKRRQNEEKQRMLDEAQAKLKNMSVNPQEMPAKNLYPVHEVPQYNEKPSDR